MPRFVILRHECPPNYVRPSHWDLMVEQGGVLRTWAMADLPTVGKSIQIDALGDHRIDYLDYEGPLSGDRGRVERWDQGTCDIEYDAADRITIRLAGARLSGTMTLVRIDPSGQRWTLTLEGA